MEPLSARLPILDALGQRDFRLAGFRYVAGVPWLWITIGIFSLVVMVALGVASPSVLVAASSAFCAAAFLAASTSRHVRSVE